MLTSDSITTTLIRVFVSLEQDLLPKTLRFYQQFIQKFKRFLKAMMGRFMQCLGINALSPFITEKTILFKRALIQINHLAPGMNFINMEKN